MEMWNMMWLCVTLGLAVCELATANPTTNSPAAASVWAKPVDQSVNLFQVTPTLFRSEQLTGKDASILQKNQVKTIINLRFFDRDDDKEDLSGLSIHLINRPLKSWSISPKQIAAILYQIELAEKQGGVLVHCYHGADRTGLIIGMYRIVNQGWSIDAAKREMVEGPYGFHTVWRNIPKMYNPNTVAQVRTELQRLRQAPSSQP